MRSYMANNYCEYSESISDLTEVEIKWLEKQITANDEAFSKDKIDWEEYFAASLRPYSHVDNFGMGDPRRGRGRRRPSRMWITAYGDDGGSLDAVANFLQKFLKKFRADEIVTITWADTCSKPRIGEFGGGAVVITAKTQKWMTTYDWAHQTVQELTGA